MCPSAGGNPQSVLHLLLVRYPEQRYDVVQAEARRSMYARDLAGGAGDPIGNDDDAASIDETVSCPAIIGGEVSVGVPAGAEGDTTVVASGPTLPQTAVSFGVQSTVKAAQSSAHGAASSSSSSTATTAAETTHGESVTEQPDFAVATPTAVVGAEHRAPGIKIGVFNGRRRFLFRGTLLENIAMGRRGVTETDVLRVCQAVRLVKRIQLKYKTGFRHVIDPSDNPALPGGTPDGLSDLECCQVLLARAIVGSPSLVVLDCPFQVLPRGTLERAVFKLSLIHI